MNIKTGLTDGHKVWYSIKGYKTMPKTAGAKALFCDNAFCVSVSPAEERVFIDDDFCLLVYVLTYDWEVFIY